MTKEKTIGIKVDQQDLINIEKIKADFNENQNLNLNTSQIVRMLISEKAKETGAKGR